MKHLTKQMNRIDARFDDVEDALIDYKQKPNVGTQGELAMKIIRLEIEVATMLLQAVPDDEERAFFRQQVIEEVQGCYGNEVVIDGKL